MIFTNEQFRRLASFETAFISAQRRYARNPGRSALQTIVQTYREATGRQLPTNYSCWSCILDILQTAGRAWLDDKAEREAAVLEQRRAALKEAESAKILEAREKSSSGPKSAEKPKKNAKK